MMNYLTAWRSRAQEERKTLEDQQQMREVQVEEYYKMVIGMYTKAAASEETADAIFEGNCINEDLLAKKDRFVRKKKISNLTQSLIEYLILLQWHIEKKTPTISQTAIYNGLLRLEKALTKTSSWELIGHVSDDDEDTCEGPLNAITDFELNLLEDIASQYVTDILAETPENVLLFPLTQQLEPDSVVKWRILEKIASVKVISEKTIYLQKLNEELQIRLKNEMERWLTPKLKEIVFEGKATILEKTKALTRILQGLNDELAETADSSYLIAPLFDAARCNYWDTIAKAMDEQLFPVCEPTMAIMDEYQKAYKDFHVNIRDSCILSYEFYCQLRELVHRLNFQVKRKSSLGPLQEISKIFVNCFLNLLHVMEVECHSRIRRATDDESRDSVNTEEKIMSSTVIVLSCLCTVIDEWRRLEIDEEDMKVAFLVKITDILCDGSKVFGKVMEDRAISVNPNVKDLEYIKRVCYLGNSVNHIVEFTTKLPKMVQWEELLKTIDDTPESPEKSFRNQICRVLNLLFQSMQSYLESATRRIYQLIALKVREQCSKYLSCWFQTHVLHTPGHQNVERLLALLHEQLETVHEYMNENSFQLVFLTDLWTSFLDYAETYFQEGKPPDYAKTIKKNMEELHKYFSDMNVEETAESIALCQRLMNTFSLNSKRTVELELDYFAHFADIVTSPDEYFGHIALQAGYKKTGRGVVDITVKVRKVQRIPVRKYDVSEVYVKLELLPKVIFPALRPVRTHSVTETFESPVFEEAFRFSGLPVSVLSIDGAVIQAIVLNQDGSFCVEALLRLNRIQNMSGLTSIDFLPVYLIALRDLDNKHAIFKILDQRKKKDRLARRFVSRKKDAVDNPSCLLRCINFINCTRSLTGFSSSTRIRTFRSFIK